MADANGSRSLCLARAHDHGYEVGGRRLVVPAPFSVTYCCCRSRATQRRFMRRARLWARSCCCAASDVPASELSQPRSSCGRWGGTRGTGRWAVRGHRRVRLRVRPDDTSAEPTVVANSLSPRMPRRCHGVDVRSLAAGCRQLKRIPLGFIQFSESRFNDGLEPLLAIVPATRVRRNRFVVSRVDAAPTCSAALRQNSC